MDEVPQLRESAQEISSALQSMGKGKAASAQFSMEIFEKELPALTTRLEQLYATNFSLAELKELVAIYATQSGRSVREIARSIQDPNKMAAVMADRKKMEEMERFTTAFAETPVGKVYNERTTKIQTEFAPFLATAHNKARSGAK